MTYNQEFDKMTRGKRSVWEILVPATRREGGRPYTLWYHRKWDAKVNEICGGLTIMTPVRGQWSQGGGVVAERMIPVRILADDRTMEKVVALTLEHYDQLAVLAYKISDQYIWGTKDAAAK